MVRVHQRLALPSNLIPVQIQVLADFRTIKQFPFAKFTTSGESPFKQTLANTSASPFGSLSFNKESPFAKIKEKEDTSKQTANVLNAETSTSMKKADETFKEEDALVSEVVIILKNHLMSLTLLLLLLPYLIRVSPMKKALR